MDWLAGNFASAAEALTDARTELLEFGDGGDALAPTWFVPQDATAAMHVYLAVARFMTADLTGADASLAESTDVSESQGFPQGPWSIDYVRWLGSWTWIESGQAR